MITRSQGWLAIAGITAALLAAGCSKSGSTQAASQPTIPPIHTTAAQASSSTALDRSTTPASTVPAAMPDPCTLLTHDEAQKIAGVPLEAKPTDHPAADPANDIASCTYSAPVTGSSGEVTIFEQQSEPRALAIDKGLGHKFTALTGVGDQATEEPENASLFIRSGQVWIYLNSAYGATPALLQQIAPKIAARLGSSTN